jgi:hypothetical protein
MPVGLLVPADLGRSATNLSIIEAGFAQEPEVEVWKSGSTLSHLGLCLTEEERQ